MTSKPVRIVCVDDSEDTRALFALMMRDNGAIQSVGGLSDVRSLERTIELSRPDVVVLDLWMPGQDPIESMRQALTRFPMVRFLVLSSDDDPAQVDRAFAGGAMGYEVKDGNYDRLVSSICRVADGERVDPAERVRGV